MATCTCYRIIFNGVMMPDIYFTYADAKAAYYALKDRSCAGYGRIVAWDDEANCVL